MKKGAIASGGALVGLSGSGLASAQEGGEQGQTWDALMYANQFHPNQEFYLVSGVIDYAPEQVEISLFSGYNARLIEYRATGETVPFFPSQDADLETGQLYSLSPSFALFENNDDALVEVDFSPLPEEQEGGVPEGNETGNATGNTTGGDGPGNESA